MTQVVSEWALRQRIEEFYGKSGYTLGWRLLYSPPDVLRVARVAFIGINPGGSHQPADHAEFAMDSGSAYAEENWGTLPGESKLQRQVLALFEIIGESPDKVLAGNLVPFRSPDWNALPHKDRALKFGQELWAEILAAAKPNLVIAMGREAITPTKTLLGVRDVKRIAVNWGNVAGERGEFDDGNFVGLPHLSRFSIVTRDKSRTALKALLGEFYRH